MSFQPYMRKPFLKRTLKYFLWITGIPIILIVLVLITLQFSQTQNYLIQKATVYLTGKLKSKVELKRIGIAFPKSIALSDLYVEDLHNDTLFYCHSFKIGINLLELFSNKIVVNSVDVENLTGHIYREFPDTTFNFSFIPSAFSSPNSDTVSESKEPETPLEFSIKSVQLTNIYFTFQDTLSGINANIKLGSFEINLKKIDLQKNEIYINSIELENTIARIVQNNPLKIDSTKSSSDSNFKLILDKIELENNSFVYDNVDMLPKAEGMDFNHLSISDFNLKGSSINVNSQEIKLNLNHLNFKEKSGFILKKFATKLIFDSTHVELSELDIQTNNSRIGNYVSFNFNSLPTQIDSIGKMQLKIDLVNTYLALSDILFFEPGVLKNPNLAQPQNTVIHLNLKMDGSVDELNLRKLEITTQKQTRVSVEGSFKNLREPDSMYIDLSSFEFATSKEDLTAIISDKILPSTITIPSTINIVARVNGYLKNFDANLLTKTSLGEIKANVKMKPSAGNKEQNYIAKIEILNLDLGKLLNQTEILGKLSMEAKIKGTGIDMDKLKAELNTTIHKAFFKGYEYKGLVIDGLITQKSFIGKASMNDKNLTFDFNGDIDLAETNSRYNFIFDLKGIDLKALHLSDENFKISGSVISNLSGAADQNISGKACLKNWAIQKADKNISIDSIVLVSKIINGNTNLSIRSKLLTLDYKGNTIMSEIPGIITEQLNTYLSVSPDSSKGKKYTEKFDFEIKLNDLTHLAENLIPDLKKLTPILINGGYDSKTKKIKFNLNVPTINYSGINTTGFKLVINSDKDKLIYSIQMAEIANPEVKVENFYLGGEIEDNTIKFQLHAQKEEEIKKIALTFKEQKEYIKAMINGKIILNNQNNTSVFTSDISVNDLSFQGVSFGDLTIHAENNLDPKIYNVKLNLSGKNNEIDLHGNYSAVDTVPKLNFKLDIINLNLAILEPFLSDQLSRMSGDMNCKLKIEGNTNSPVITGLINFKKCGFKPKSIDSYLTIDDAQIKLESKKIIFDSFTLIDSLKNKAIINGYADFQNPDEINFDLWLKSKNFLALNTLKKDNPLYYGTIYLDSDIHLKGTQNNPFIDVNIKLNEGTVLTYVKPENEVSKIESNGIVEFIDTSKIRTMLKSVVTDTMKKPSTITGINLNAIVNIDENVELRMLLDPFSGDSIFVKGEASLNFNIDPSGTSSLSGKYSILDGGCHLVLNPFVKKDFKVASGSFITWSGDVMEANVDIKTVYTLRISPLELMQDGSEIMDEGEKAKYQQLVTFLVFFNMKGLISAPEISFDIQLPPDETENVSILEKLNTLREDESELNKQVFALLAMNKFISENSSEAESENEGDASNSARAGASKILTSQLNKYSKKYVKGVDLNLGVNSYEDNSSGEEEGRTQLKVGIDKQLFKNRLKVHVGGNLDLEGENPEVDSDGSDGGESDADDVARDIRVDYKITKDGRYVLKLFRKIEYENPIEGELTKGGLGIIYTKEYNKLMDLFKNNKK